MQCETDSENVYSSKVKQKSNSQMYFNLINKILK